MSKCPKIKNPCKICKNSVSPKNGLQCKGACRTWVHYKCLNYTPGKIADVKNGIIKILCPCPDCKPNIEVRTDQPYACDTAQCPINDTCGEKFCSENLKKPKKGGKAIKCGTDECIKYSLRSTQTADNSKCNEKENSNSKPVCPITPPTPPKSQSPKVSSKCSEPKLPRCCSKPTSPKTSSPETSSPMSCSEPPSPGDLSPQNSASEVCAPPRSSSRALDSRVIEEMSKTITQLARQVNKLMKNQNCSNKGVVAKFAAYSTSAECRPRSNKARTHAPKTCHCPDNPQD